MPQKNVFGKPADCSRVLLHACCAPCSSAIVEWLLDNGVQPVIYYYNPNIWPRQEYEIRKQESKRHADSLGISWIDDDYDHDAWLDGVSKCEWRVASSDNSPEEQNYDAATEPERGRRCQQCFYLRLLATARKARELGIRYFATTLASSRWKSLDQVNRAGKAAAAMVSNEGAGTVNGVQTVTFWAQNWRKGGLQERRNELLRTFGFYNQQYCGCEFSASRLPTKELLRHQMRELKRQHAARLADYSAAIADRLQAILLSCVPSVASEQSSSAPSTLHTSTFTPSQDTVLAYWPLPDEPDLRPLLDKLVEQDFTVLLPRVTGETTMELRRYTGAGDLQEGAFHIMEPTGQLFTDYDAIGTALVPGMAFDAAGHRLGRGRGYYDRLLPQLHNARTVGVCFPFQRVAEVPTESHDVTMHQVVS